MGMAFSDLWGILYTHQGQSSTASVLVVVVCAGTINVLKALCIVASIVMSGAKRHHLHYHQRQVKRGLEPRVS